jgi:hypothetical protein
MKGYYQYAADGRDGRALVGEFIKQAVERFYTLFERDDIEFREERAEYAIEFIALLRHYPAVMPGNRLRYCLGRNLL